MIIMTEIFITGIFPNLNEEINLAKRHWSNYSKTKKKFTDSVAWQVKKLPKFTNVDLEFVWYCKDKRIDPDNRAFSQKYIIDGLVQAEVLPDDGWNNVRSLHHTFIVTMLNGVLLKIREVE